MHLKHTHLSVLELKMKNSCSSPTPRVPTSPQVHLAVRWDLFFFSQKLFCHTLCLYLSFYPNRMWIIPWIDFPHTGERNAFVPLLNILDLCEFSNIFVFVCVCVQGRKRGGLEPWMLTASISVNAGLLSPRLSSAPPSLFLVWWFTDTVGQGWHHQSASAQQGHCSDLTRDWLLRFSVLLLSDLIGGRGWSPIKQRKGPREGN